VTREVFPLGNETCVRHAWAGELLHTFTAVGFVTVRVCNDCGAVSRTHEPLPPVQAELRKIGGSR
jgi:hypothetical protein